MQSFRPRTKPGLSCRSRRVIGSLSRVALWAAERVVPKALRDGWIQEWRGGLWEFTLRAGATRELIRHTRLAVTDALRRRDWPRLTGRTGFCIAAVSPPFLTVAR